MFDALTVPIVCGGGDVSVGTNYAFKPIQVQVYENSADTETLVKLYDTEYGHLQWKPETSK